VIVEVWVEALFIRLFLFELALVRCVACKKHWQIAWKRTVPVCFLCSLLGTLQWMVPGHCFFAIPMLFLLDASLQGWLSFGIRTGRELLGFLAFYMRFGCLISGSCYVGQRLWQGCFPDRINGGAVLIGILFLLYPGFERYVHTRRSRYRVCLKMDGKQYTMKALLDTGNQMLDPMEQRPIYVLSTREATLRETIRKGKIHEIPCTTVLGETTLMAYEADALLIFCDGGHRTVWRPLIAIGEANQKENYMILSGIME